MDDDDAGEAVGCFEAPVAPELADGGARTMSAMMKEMERRIWESARARELESFAAEEKFCGSCGKRIPRISERLKCRACFSRESGAIQRMRARARLQPCPQ
jgi:NADH pyrophosphatase NudC (nudix superfamily)